MNQSKDKHFSDSWFFKWFLNNQAVIVLLITFLVFLTLFLFTKISFLFMPVLSFMGIVMLPLVIAALLYYLLKPSVIFLNNRGLGLSTSIMLVFAIVIGLLVWAGSGFFPMIRIS